MQSQRRKFAILIVSFTVITFGWISIGTGAEEVPYVSIEQLRTDGKDMSQTQFRLGGYVVPGTINYSDDHLSVNFTMVQEDAELMVRFKGLPPDMFKDDAEVIIEGSMEGETFVADNLMTKCASRYEADLSEPGIEAHQEI